MPGQASLGEEVLGLCLCWSCIFESGGLHAFTWVQHSFAHSDSTLSSDLISAKLSRIFCQFIVTLRVNSVWLYVYVSVCSVCTVLMLICPNGQHYQFVGFPLLCSVNSNITPSLQFPPAATCLNLSRSYQHNSLMTIQLSGWREHQHTNVYTRTPTRTYMNTYRHSHMSCVSDGNIVFMLFFATLPPGNTLPSHKKKETNFTQEITSILSSGKSFS